MTPVAADFILAMILNGLDALRQLQGGELTDDQLNKLRDATQAKVDAAEAAAAKALGETK